MHLHSRPMSPAPGPSFEDVGGLRVLTKQLFKYVDADGLLDIPDLERLNPARLAHHGRRQVVVDGTHMNVLSDVAALTCFQYSKDARSWSMNRRHVNELTAPSLVYMQGGQEVGCCAAVAPCCVVRKGVMLTACL